MISPDTIAEVIRRYRDGYTVPTIAYALNVAPDTIKRHLRANGVPLRDDRSRGQGPTRTADRIAAAGTTTRQIRAWAHAQGFPVHPSGQLPDAIIDAYLNAHTEQEHTQP